MPMSISTTIRYTIQLYKAAYSDHPKEVWALAILTLINRMGTMVLPFLSVYLTTVLNFSFKEAGLLASAFGVGSLIGTYVGGRLADKFGGNAVIIGSLFIGGLCFIGLQTFTSFYGLFVMIMITSMFGESYRPAMIVSMANYVPASATGRSTSLLRLAINLGMSISPFVAGLIAVNWGYDYLFWIDGFTCMLAAVVFLIFIQQWQKQEKPEPETYQVETKPKVLIPPYQNRNYMVFLVATFLMGFIFMQWFHTAPVFLKTEWGFGEDSIGMLLGFSSFLVILIEMPLIDSLEKANLKVQAVRIGICLLGGSFLIFLFPAAFYLCFIAIAIWTMGEILILPFNMSLALSMSQPENRGEYQGFYWVTWSLVQIATPLLGLGFAEAFGFSNLWIALTVIMIISLVLYRLVDE